MSDTVDEDLLGGEDELDDYDITNETEEALLRDDEDYTKKEEDYSDERDVLELDLDLGIDEDFDDEEDKLLEDEPEEKKDKFQVERPVSQKVVSNIATSPVKRAGPIVNKTVPQKKQAVFRNDKRKRGGGRNFQNRQNFGKGNGQRRRNGTVLINPRYEGTVHINDNNARLSWDNTPQVQNNTHIQPWTSGTPIGSCDPNLLVTNIMSGIANTLAQAPPNILLTPNQPQPQNFYEPPPREYEPPLSFEPPPNIANDRSLNNYSQVAGHQMLPASNSYTRNTQNYNNQNAKMQSANQRFNSYSNYDQTNSSGNMRYNKNVNYSYTAGSTPNTGSYDNQYRNNGAPAPQTNFQNRNVEFKQNKNFDGSYNYTPKNEYNNTPKNNYNNPPRYDYNGPSQYDYNNHSKYDYNYDCSNFTGNNSVTAANQSNTTYSKQNNRKEQHGQYKRDFNKPPALGDQRNQKLGTQNNRFGEKLTRQVHNRTGDWNKAVSENKGLKMDIKMERGESDEEIKKPENKTIEPAADEDEETRLYRQKIEEQKRERERLLKIKEERRKQMMEQRQTQTKNLLVPEDRRNLLQQRQQEKAPVAPPQNSFQPPVQKPQNRAPRQSANVVLSAPDDMTLTFKVTNNVVDKVESSSTGFMSNRVVMVKSKVPRGGTLANSDPKPAVAEAVEPSDQSGSSFFNNRKVLKKDNSLLNTRLVVANNLSTSINQEKLISLSRGIGEIEKLRVDAQERQATILFKSVASAHAFFKKYQRRILDDLSVIEVKLEPML